MTIFGQCYNLLNNKMIYIMYILSLVVKVEDDFFLSVSETGMSYNKQFSVCLNTLCTFSLVLLL